MSGTLGVGVQGTALSKNPLCTLVSSHRKRPSEGHLLHACSRKQSRGLWTASTFLCERDQAFPFTPHPIPALQSISQCPSYHPPCPLKGVLSAGVHEAGQ